MSDIAASEVLIELVRGRPCLFDKKNPSYKDTRGIKSNNWKDVGAAMAEAGFEQYADPAAAIDKWNKIRDNFAGACTRHEKATRSGAAADRPNNWQLYKQMEWYLDYTKRRNTATNIPEAARTNVAMAEETSIQSSLCDRAETAVQSPTASSSASQPSQTSQPSQIDRPIPPASPALSSVSTNSGCAPKRKRPADDLDAALLASLQKIDERLLTAPPSQAESSAGHFAAIVAEQAGTLGPAERAEYMAGIQNIYLSIVHNRNRTPQPASFTPPPATLSQPLSFRSTIYSQPPSSPHPAAIISQSQSFPPTCFSQPNLFTPHSYSQSTPYPPPPSVTPSSTTSADITNTSPTYTVL